MTKFIDGPAAGQTIPIHRAPLLLRVVRDGQTWDALDQLDDKAKPTEEIFVYIADERPRPVHIRAEKGSGWYWIGNYRLLSEQPADEILRDNTRWAEWCMANKDRLTPEWAKSIVE